VPLLEKLAAAACKETRAVGVLEALTAHAPARAAMLSLAAALAGDVEEDDVPDAADAPRKHDRSYDERLRPYRTGRAAPAPSA
jgi:hypothetical protein